MFARYGSKWSSQYPNDLLVLVQQEWADELKDISLHQIKTGLENWRKDWPPNLIEFSNACKDLKDYEPSHVKWKGLPKLDKPISELKTEKTAIEKMKEYLK